MKPKELKTLLLCTFDVSACLRRTKDSAQPGCSAQITTIENALSGTELVNLILLRKHKVQKLKALKHDVRIECSGINSWKLKECQPNLGFAVLWRKWMSNTHGVLVEGPPWWSSG